MSIYVTSDVWENSTQKGGALLVLLALADNADRTTRLAWPSVSDLARRSRMSKRQVQYILRKLEEAGEIKTITTGGIIDGKRKATVYRVFHSGDRESSLGSASPVLRTGDAERDTKEGAKDAPMQSEAGKGAISAPEGVKPIALQPSVNRNEPSTVPQSEKEKAAARRRRDYDWLFD